MWYRVVGLIAGGLLTLGPIAGAQESNVRVMAAPHARITDFRSFHLLPTPLRPDRVRRRDVYDPMTVHSAANRALWKAVARELVDRGYVDSEWMPDFVVAIYASIDERLDLAAWSYGYTYSPRWWSLGAVGDAWTLFPAGAVVVDVVNPETRDVLWRGTGTATIAADPLENARELLAVATAIIDRFPRAKPVVIANMR
jgi:Domain of unknown function (DUF4136)